MVGAAELFHDTAPGGVRSLGQFQHTVQGSSHRLRHSVRRGDAVRTCVLAAAECPTVPRRPQKCSLLCDDLCELRRVPAEIQLRSRYVMAGTYREAACHGFAYNTTDDANSAEKFESLPVV